MFWKVMISLIVIMALSWAAYAIWNHMEDIKEKNEPKRKTEHLEQIQKSFEEYTKKVASFKKPPHNHNKNT